MVECARQFARWCALRKSTSRRHRHLGLLVPLVGRSIRGTKARRTLEQGNPRKPGHQLARNGGHSLDDLTPGETMERQMCAIPDGQQHHSRQHQQAGRNPLAQHDVVYTEPPRADDEKQHHPRSGALSWKTERRLRLDLEAKRDLQERVADGSSILQEHPKGICRTRIGAGNSRSLRERDESPAPALWLATLRRGGSPSQRTASPMAEGRGAVRLPTDNHTRQSTGQDSGGATDANDIDRTVNAEHDVIPDTQAHREESRLSRRPQPATTSLELLPPGPLVNPFGNVENKDNRLVSEGYSRDVLNRLHSARRPSTNQVYASKWAVYERFCRERGYEASSSSPGVVTEFLNYLDREKKLAPSTIKAYRAAIGHMTRLETGYDPGEDKVCSLLVKSIERGHAPKEKRVPSWDVSIVLKALLKPGLENDHLSRHLLTAKTTFLLALATGERRSGLHALSSEVLFEDSSPASMRLHFLDSYVPKSWFVRKNKVGVDAITIPCVDDEQLEQLCPVHTVVSYLQIVKNSRLSSQASLLIPHAPSNTNNLSLHAVARYIVKLVHWAYQQQGLAAPKGVKGHDTRGIAASLAALSGVKLSEVLASGNWASANTFLRHYYRRFSPDFVHNLVDLPKFVAGKKLISSSSVAELRKQQPNEETTDEGKSQPPPQSNPLPSGQEESELHKSEARSPPPKKPDPSADMQLLRIPGKDGTPPTVVRVQRRTLRWVYENCKNRPSTSRPL